jgi:hypothetical protein
MNLMASTHKYVLNMIHRKLTELLLILRLASQWQTGNGFSHLDDALCINNSSRHSSRDLTIFPLNSINIDGKL